MDCNFDLMCPMWTLDTPNVYHIMPGHHMLNVQVVFIISTLIPYLVIFTCYIQIVRTFKCSKRRLYQVSNFSNFNKADKV